MSFVIAEIGTSHGASIEKAKKLIDAAAQAGADAAKFQWIYADEILHPNTGFVDLPTGKIPLYQKFCSLECPYSFYKETAEYTRKKGLKYICSPFGIKSLKELLNLKPDFIKIASPELNHYPILQELAGFRKNQIAKEGKAVPVIISSGVSKLADIEKALEILGTNGVTLLHCITSYPAPEDEYNLKLIASLANIFGVKTGVSDHSLDPILVPCLSISQGASIIEKHITLTKKTSGLDDPVALEPEQFALMTHCVRQSSAAIKRYGFEKGAETIICQMKDSYGKEKVECILGDGIKRLASSEKANYGRTNRSLHFMRDLKAGEIITKKDIGILRTEKILSPGISPEFLEIILNSRLSSDVENGSGVKFKNFIK